MDFNAFSHGQMHSKLWLCENLEPYMPKGANVIIIGSWYNLMGLMLLSRNDHYNFIKGIDIDPSAVFIANQLCQSWMIQPDLKMYNEVADANNYNFGAYNVIINCSVEHMLSTKWFDNLHSGTLVCTQSSDVIQSDENFDIKNPNQSLDDLCNKFPMRTFYNRKIKRFRYNDWGYTRLMTIGIK